MPNLDKREVRQIFISGKTQWRAYMNVHARQIDLVPPVLDMGSGAMGTASYQRYIPRYADLTIHSVDLDPNRRPTVLANLNDPIPYADASFNTCLAFGVFNYFYNFEDAAQEVYRVLRPNGTAHINIPFLDRVTSDYGDSVRLTAHALTQMLEKAGFIDVVITPFGSGAFGAALDQIEFVIPRPFRGLAMRTALLLDSFVTRKSGGKYRNANDYPLGYYACGRKPA